MSGAGLEKPPLSTISNCYTFSELYQHHNHRYRQNRRTSADVSALNADIVASKVERFMMVHNVLRMFHDVLLVVHDVLLVVRDVSQCFTL